MKPVHAMLIIAIISILAMTDLKIREPLDETEYLARPDDRAFRANNIVVASIAENDARSAASAPNIR